ncbi:MAG: UDP-N-acetylmuramoyl-L-alanyl-D-glutamate--2,6-diaminopimelate ligase [Bacillota bacterium]
MNLKDLIEELAVLRVEGSDEIEIKGISYDSRTVEPGFLFVAIEGYKADGHHYVTQAVEAGAAAVMAQKEVDVPSGVTLVKAENTRVGLAQVSAAFYGHPCRRMRMVGVTGTNGKTTTTNLIASVYRSAGRKVGLIGTIANYIGDRKLDVSHTTPESTDLQKLLREMVDEKVEVAVIEVSSHALQLERVMGCEYDVAVFTNLTQDHLDFHRDMGEYFEAKAKLFRYVGSGVKEGPKHVVVNRDDPHAERMMSVARVPVITYGLSEKAHFKAVDVKVTGHGCSFTVVSEKYGSLKLNMKLTGLFNVYNTLAAYAAGVAGGLSPHEIKGALEQVRGIPGRFELVDRGQDFTVAVDYAHTPDGLENILKAARAVSGGKIITVFGCGGDRDRTKRPVMGEIAGRYSDLPIITSDNPRTEDPLGIIRDIEEGIKKVMQPGNYRVIPDRRDAIRAAIDAARKGDMVVIAGKGHEDYQIVGDSKFHFDDREEAGRALESNAKPDCAGGVFFSRGSG